MIQTYNLLPGVTLRCFRDPRFKQACLSLQLVRPMCKEEAAMNALVPAVLLRGCTNAPDLRSITLRLDELYGASVGALVRRVGDWQTTGFYCSFISDPYTLEGESLLTPMVDFLRQLFWEPCLEDGHFRRDYVESEKKNLIAAIESQRNDKRAYASAQMLKKMCAGDSFGIPRLGEAEDVAAIDAQNLYAHYRKLLQESRVELFYVGDGDLETLSKALLPLFPRESKNYVNLPPQTILCPGAPGSHTEHMEVAQGKLCMGFTTPISTRDPNFAAMQVCNVILGAGMTSKLFVNIREKLSLCYDIGSSYHGSKGLLTVSAGIDWDKADLVREQILAQLKACVDADISEEELASAKEALCSSLRSVHDAPSAIESFYAVGALSGLGMTPAQYMEKVYSVTVQDAAAAAATLVLHTQYLLRGDN